MVTSGDLVANDLRTDTSGKMPQLPSRCLRVAQNKNEGWVVEAVETILNMMVGVGLAATCGFRVFVPFLVLSLAAMAGYTSLSGGFQWMASYPAVLVFGVATLVEILAYFFPFVDNLLSAASAPISVMAGVLVTAAVMADVSPVLQWTLAVIAGGGAASAASFVSNGLHHGSTITSGGAANPFVSAVESVLAVLTAALAVIVPLLTALLIAASFFFLYKRWKRLKRKLRL